MTLSPRQVRYLPDRAYLLYRLLILEDRLHDMRQQRDFWLRRARGKGKA